MAPSIHPAYGAIRRGVNVLALALLMSAGPASASEPLRILALGDSLTAGYGLSRADSFTTRLERALDAAGYPAEVIDAGVSGDTSAGGRARLDWLLTEDPDVVLIELGANDGLRGLDPAMTEANLDAIIARAKASGAAVLLSGMRAPPNLGPEYAAEFEPIYRRLADKHGVALQPFFLEGVAARPDLNQDDGIHPNAKGMGLVVEGLLPHIRKVIDGIGE